MLQLLIALTVVEAVLGVGVLALYLTLIYFSLKSSVRYAAKISFGVRAIETQAGQVGPSVTKINSTLEEIAGALPGIAEKAERRAAGR